LNIVGSWNPAILNPNWLSNNVFHVDTVSIEMGLLQPGGIQVSITANNVNIIPYKDRVMIRPLNYESETLDLCDNYARELLTLLPHTPIAAAGVNMSFVLKEDYPDKLIQLFEDDDEGEITNDFASIQQKVYSRKLLLSHRQNVELNYKVIYDNISLANENISLEFNYHHPKESVGDLQGLIRGFNSYKELSLDFLNRVYELELEN